jgi:hypothetical protein
MDDLSRNKTRTCVAWESNIDCVSFPRVILLQPALRQWDRGVVISPIRIEMSRGACLIPFWPDVVEVLVARIKGSNGYSCNLIQNWVVFFSNRLLSILDWKLQLEETLSIDWDRSYEEHQRILCKRKRERLWISVGSGGSEIR